MVRLSYRVRNGTTEGTENTEKEGLDVLSTWVVGSERPSLSRQEIRPQCPPWFERPELKDPQRCAGFRDKLMVWKTPDERSGVGRRQDLLYEHVTKEIIGAGIAVHRALGPGLLESAYEQCLCHELTLRSIRFARQVSLAVRYKGLELDCGYRADLLVEDAVILELKAVDRLMPIHEAQLLTYLQLSQKRVGLLMNFNVMSLRRGIVRRVL